MSASLQTKIEAELLEHLNEVQKKAVLHSDGPLLILAGAGSGKTRVITHRIAHMARIRGVPPYRIAAVTFTNKAAEEMRSRLYGLMGPMSESVLVRTFHSLGLYILRRNAADLGLKSNFSIYDSGDQEALIKKILKNLKIESSWMTPKAVAERINRARDQMQSPEQIESAGNKYDEEIVPVYKDYMEMLRKNNALDFGDLIYETVRLFEKNPEVLAGYQDLWKYFMIDEYQDTNHAQYMLGRLIAQKHRNIAVVGDDDQSIYSWRGADITNILSFEKDYPSCLVLRLEENYRSTSHILKAASSLIKNNTSRRDKTLYTRKEGGEKLVYTTYESDGDEANGVVNKMQTLKSQGIPYPEMAVFYRTNAQSRMFEEMLRRASIPYILVGGFRFYDRKEIKDLIAYLSVIVNPEGSVALERIINTPPRGLGEAGLARIQSHSLSNAISLYDAMGQADQIDNVRGFKSMMQLHSNFEKWRNMDQAQPSAILQSVLEDTGYMSFLEKDENPGESRMENIEEFLNSVRDYEESEAEPSLGSYLQQIALYTSETVSEEGDAVNLITLHNAKGLEYRVVFFTGLEEGTLPHSFSLEDGIEEERRLAYVGITRARELLFLSTSRFRRVQGSYQPRLPSRFLEEIDPDVLDGTRNQREAAYPAAGGYGGYARNSRPAPPPQTRPPLLGAARGQRVKHATYGPGEIRSVEETVAGTKVGIQFDGDDRTRYFLTRYTPLERIQ